MSVATSNSLSKTFKTLSPLEQEIFQLRYNQHLPDALRPLRQLYGDRDDFDEWIARFVKIIERAYAERPPALRLLDLKRSIEPDWFQKPNMVGYICYTERFAGSLLGVIDKIPYLKELGITYLHLMPLLQPRPGPNDGGYAVANYREVDQRLGSIEDLAVLAAALHESGISLCIDLVCNHTAQEHKWAQRALTGDPKYQDYYFIFPDRTVPDQYEQTLREIFPESDPGNFTYYEEIDSWVWTTFHSYQWDLNYRNPAVFGEMLDIILNLANHGVEVVRLDAVAFMWKEMGTSSENLPEAHAILQAFRALTLIACPALIFKAEAIVAPHEVVPYLGRGLMANKECEIAYHNSFMVYMWSMLAERNVRLSTYSLQNLPEIPSRTTWVTYVRLHDDIGWAIMDDFAAAVGLNGFWHRSFLSDFYSGQHPNTFARGDIFQFNPKTMDRRVSGATASLAGLETALEAGDDAQIDLAIRRILLIHNMIYAVGGIPLLYMGDELGLTNNYDYLNNPDLAHDNRNLQRPFMDWELAEKRHVAQSPAGRLFQGMCHLAQVRAATLELHGQAASQAVWTHNDSVFGILRDSPRGRLLVLGNFTEESQLVPDYRLSELGFEAVLQDKLTGRSHSTWHDLYLEPYAAVWLVEK